MGIYKTKHGWIVKSYSTGKWHKKRYKTYNTALKASGEKARRKYMKAKHKKK
jgi:hypothetical protein|tara:strand:+ start:773 stop:928 length:156 start_codon:yes stop_codon:yes gene_type:complete